ncbi:MAG TPA: Cj0069 family protein [Ramlibacter sp.]
MDSSAVALLYPGDRATRDRSDPAESRFAALFDAFARAGIDAVPAVYNEDFADEVEAQLRGAALVLVWCNPIEGGRRRDKLDAMLRRVAERGTIVSAHPDAILKLGTKDVLVDTRDLPFGSDVHRIDELAQLESDLPARLAHGPRVLKQYRGHSGIGVWRVERIEGSAPLRVRHAQRGSEEESISLRELCERLSPYFEAVNGGHMIDQPWQPRIVDGMIRAYLVQDRVAGFGHQPLIALHPTAQPGPRLYYEPAQLPQFAGLKRKLETEWVAMLCERAELPHDQLPLLWDCDFMFGEPGADGSERYVLCEINVSSVSPFPPSAVAAIVAAARARLA